MPQSSFALLTNLGRQKEAAALANGTAVVITHIAIGDAATVPSGGETQLYSEVDRKTISGQGVVSGAPTVAYADIYLAAEDGPYTIREAGLIDQDGDLIAIAHYEPPISKPTPDSGQTVEGTIRIEVAFTDLAAVTIKVDPSMAVALQRLSVMPWIPVKSVTTTTPPASPALGDTYVIPAGATGSWATHANKVAEYTLAGWAIVEPKDGHGVGLPDGSEYIRIAGVYLRKSHFARNANADIPVLNWMTTPPATPAEGDRYVVMVGGVGAWAGQDNKIALYVGGTWTFASPLAGLQVQYWSGRQIALRFDGATWAEDLAGVAASGRVALATEQEVIDAIGDDVVQAKWLTHYARRLIENTTFYVRTDGSDTNNGLANTAGGAFRTLQGAIDSIKSRFSATGKLITINVGLGTSFGTGNFDGMSGFKVKLIGSGTGTQISSGTMSGDLIRAAGSIDLEVRALKLVGGGRQIAAEYGARIRYGDIDFTPAGQYQTQASYGGIVQQIAYSIINGDGTTTSQSFLTATDGTVDITNQSIALLGTCSFSVGFAYASAGFITAGGAAFSGTQTGRRYFANVAGIIYTGTDVGSGANQNFFPGSSAGVLSSGGLYY